MNITVNEFVKEFKEKKIFNSKLNEHAISDYLKEKLAIKTYIPFRLKREIAEIVVSQNTEWVDGIKKHDSVNAYVSFIVASLTAHTNLEFSDDPVADYDLLAESGLLPLIIAEFESSYSECDIILKMVLAMELEDNNINALVGKFLNGILEKLDVVGDVLKDKLGNFDLKDILGADFKQEDLAKLSGFLNKLS
jgi:hypothetical protein